MNETAKRIISGLILGALACGALYTDFFNWILLFALLFLFSQMGLYEFYHLTDRGIDGRPFRKLGAFFGGLIVVGYYAQFLAMKSAQGYAPDGFAAWLIAWFYPNANNLAPTLLFLFLIFASVLQILTRPLDGTIYNLAVSVGGIVYTTLGVCHGMLLMGLDHGVFYLVLFAVLPISTDTGAYFAGRWFGRHNAGLKVSPKKTYEGYAGGIVTAVLIGVGFLYGWNAYAPGAVAGVPMHPVEIAIVAFVIAFVSIFGDLAESAFKRDAKIKDSASTIPGHGGMLDLADAIYFSLPVGYFYLTYKAMLGFGL
jgi:phosphatidate cytidylyltransferase